eukprot:TRINITY_DN21821_c0_g1_i1.p2 TRINITY_DN21821_c0_g1~~TRINITY_DN21821_c0_g1_i1.p2  ORF type:complete len:170 (-),score=9.92 TRINITY_DN21821_c0_g1_i1:162-671(-)
MYSLFLTLESVQLVVSHLLLQQQGIEKINYFCFRLYTTHYSCNYSYGSCSLYETIQVDAAFCFIIIFLPWIGCMAGLLGSKAGAIIYGIIIFGITICILVCCSAILANGDMRDTWKTARDEDQLTTNAPEVSGMIIYNICIAQIILVWFFLLGGAGTTIFAAKKQSELH